MAIRVIMPKNGDQSIMDFLDIIDFVSTQASIFDFSASGFSGSGSYFGGTAGFDATGSGFSLGQIGGQNYLVTGVLATIDFWEGPFTSEDDVVAISSLDIDMSVFSQIVAADVFGSAPLAIENYFLNRDWDVTLGNGNDIAPNGTQVGDGINFNLKGNDTIRGMGGNDNLFSGAGNDKLFGNNGKDILSGGTGRDIINGGKGRDVLRGEAGNDKLVGGTGNDKLFGGAGKDVLDGGKNNDLLVGGGGSDKFVFRDGGGANTIRDFAANNNKEDIVLKAVSEITGFNDLKNNHMTKSGSDVLIDDGAGLTIMLKNVDIADLNAADFIF